MVAPVVGLSTVPVPIVPPAVPDVVESDIVEPDVEPRALDTLCGSVDVVDPVVLVGGFA